MPNDIEITEENFRETQFSMPWQYDPVTKERRDSDGFPIKGSGPVGTERLTRDEIHGTIWNKFHNNPHVNTSVRGLVGRIAGNGFATVSNIPEIEEVILETETDYRNRLFDYWPKMITRAFIAGELFLIFTCHDNGFIEVDFLSPTLIEGQGDAKDGIIFHPWKTRMPLIYCVKDSDNDIDEHLPSIYLARYPELIAVAKQNNAFSSTKLIKSRSRKKAYRGIGGFKRFVVSWDLGLITSRSNSHIATIIQWLNHWENLKKYEIDHKKSAGAYVWVVRFSDVKSWITWLNLTDEQRSKTGLAAPKTPGGTLVIGPNMEIKAEMPQLPKISEGDSDIMQMVSSGLNEPADVTTGQAKGTYASIKASRGPLSDKVSDEMTYFERWLRWDFWGNIFFLKSKISNFPDKFKIREATKFVNKEPVFAEVEKKPEQCIECIFPVSAIEDIESHAKAFLGVKHGSLYDTAGIPNEEILRRLGFRGYGKLRLKQATEEETYPEIVLTIDQESLQEQREGE